MEGYIYLFRKIQDSWIWSRPDYFHWFITMIFKANYKTQKVIFESKLINVKRGSFITSIRKFASELPRCSEQKLRTFLHLLEQDNIIKVSIVEKRATQISILKYDSYQMFQHSHNTTATQSQHNRNTNSTQASLQNQHNTNTINEEKTAQDTTQLIDTISINYKDKHSTNNTSKTQGNTKNNTSTTQAKSELKIRSPENQQQYNKRIKNKIINKKKNVSHSEKEIFSEYSVQILKLFNTVKNYFPEKIISGLKPENKKAWLDTLEKLNRIDGYDFDEIEKMIRTTRNHEFWSKNFLTLTKLRKSDKDGVKYHIRFSQLTEKVSGKINDKTKKFSSREDRMSWS